MAHRGNQGRFWDAWDILLIVFIVTAFTFDEKVEALHYFPNAVPLCYGDHSSEENKEGRQC